MDGLGDMLDKIFCMDCMEGMKMIPDGTVDCIICDLPYEVLHKNNPNAQWDRIIPFEPLWEQYLRITKENAAIILFCQGMFTCKLMMSQPNLWRYNLVWNKQRVTGFLNANRMPLRCHEDIAVFYRSLPTYNPQMEIGVPSHPQGNGKHKKTNSCYGEYGRDYQGRTYESVRRVAPTNKEGEKFPKSIINIKKEHESTVLHPTQKPVALIEYLIRTYTNEGDLVLDNCMGSGTTAIACLHTKRNFIGFETDKEYYDKASKRIENARRFLTLF